MERLLKEARQILDLNWKDGFTIPAAKLYPFQWNWDSGFVSIGMSHYRLDRSIQELQSLFSGQWGNGMLPHIIFHSENEKTYFPNYDFWNAAVNPGAPIKPKTSGISQPPVHGFVLEHLLQRFPDHEELELFAREIFPNIVRSHRFYYKYRDPKGEGLFFIFHPWASGRDNSPLWDSSLKRIQIRDGDLPAYQRRDLSLADASERPTAMQYDRYVYLLLLGQKYQYDGPEIAEESPFLIQDCMMNAILIKSNQSLINIGKRLNLDTREIEEWQQQSLRSFHEKFWNDRLGIYTCYDMRAEAQLEHKEIGGLIPVFAGIPSVEDAKKLNDYLVSLHQRGYYICPSFDVDSPLFDSRRYWRGPIWPHMNWMIHHGLKDYGHAETAEILRSDVLELVSNLGFCEYYESQKSVVPQLKKGYGGELFSWCASTVIDFLHT